MKKIFLFALVATLFAACATDATQDVAPEIPTSPDELYVAFDAEDSRVQLGENGAPVWTEGDLVSVFYRSNAHDKYEFTGETGDTDGTLKRVSQGIPTMGLDKVIALYPYNANYLLSPLSGNIKASLPAEQTYLADSYGVGSSLMVSSSKTDLLYLKNVCGWLKLQFTGEGSIEKIVLRGNCGEQVAGDIYICSDDASCTLAGDLTGADGTNSGDLGGALVDTNTILTSVILNCGDGVTLNSETPTAFYIALPPQTFEKGITIAAVCDGGTARTKSTENSLTVERNHIVPMASLAVEQLEITETPEIPDTPAQPTPPANEIWYTTTDGKKLLLDCTSAQFGAILISDKYENGKGILTFDDKVTSIGNKAFYKCNKLTSITIPNSVTSIGNYAFHSCYALKSVTIGNSVTSIGNYAFSDCYALTSITIPNSVTSIGEGAFAYCSALESVTIPDSVTEIGEGAFSNCKALKSVNIPNSVTSIGNDAFFGCNALTSINIPNSVTSIGESAFYSCDALESVTIGNSVTSIGNDAFRYCSALKEVYCKPTTPPTADIGTSSYWDAFFNNASGRKIYVPTASEDAYKAAKGWSDYASYIEPYNFTE